MDIKILYIRVMCETPDLGYLNVTTPGEWKCISGRQLGLGDEVWWKMFAF